MALPSGQIRKWKNSVALNGTNAVAVKACRNTTSTLWVTKLTLSVTTHAAATFVARDTTPTTIAAHTDAAAGAGVPSKVTWDFGRGGVKLALGKDFEIVGGSGVAGYCYAEGYEIYTP